MSPLVGFAIGGLAPVLLFASVLWYRDASGWIRISSAVAQLILVRLIIHVSFHIITDGQHYLRSEET